MSTFTATLSRHPNGERDWPVCSHFPCSHKLLRDVSKHCKNRCEDGVRVCSIATSFVHVGDNITDQWEIWWSWTCPDNRPRLIVWYWHHKRETGTSSCVRDNIRCAIVQISFVQLCHNDFCSPISPYDPIDYASTSLRATASVKQSYGAHAAWLHLPVKSNLQHTYSMATELSMYLYPDLKPKNLNSIDAGSPIICRLASSFPSLQLQRSQPTRPIPLHRQLRHSSTDCCARATTQRTNRQGQCLNRNVCYGAASHLPGSSSLLYSRPTLGL